MLPSISLSEPPGFAVAARWLRGLATWHGRAKKEQDVGTAPANTNEGIVLRVRGRGA
jgi:hypothetical protein